MPAGLPNEEDILARGGEDNELEVSVVDDTPEQDRGRTPLSKEKLKQALEPSDEEMERYSADVKKRILQLQHAAHDQRRIAEEALRERAAAEEFAKAQIRKTQELQSRFAAGEKVFVGGMQEKAKVSIEAAEAELKAATEAFDADAIVKANRKLTQALMEEQRYANWQPQPPSQAESDVVQTRTSEQQPRQNAPKPDAKAQAWATKNTWFGDDDEMTSFAYGVDAKLAKQGITAATDPDGYYGAIDRRMREVFPDRFEEQDDPPERNARREQETQPRTTVAPVRRSASGKRVVTLTKSQESMAKRLGLTTQQYAASLVELEKRNG